MFGRDKMLIDAGLRSFVPDLQFARDICETEEAFSEFKEECICAAKERIERNDEEWKQWRDKVREKWEMRRTGDPWDIIPTSFFSWRSSQMRAKSVNEYQRLRAPYEEEKERLWREEVGKFTFGVADALVAKEGGEPKQRSSMAKKVLRAAVTRLNLGFETDEATKVGGCFIVSKPIAPAYKLTLVLTLKGINSDFGERELTAIRNDTGEMFTFKNRGVQLSMLLTVFPSAARTYGERVTGIHFDNLFPIDSRFEFFRSLKELEALINIHATMCKLILPELEPALVKDLTRAAA